MRFDTIHIPAFGPFTDFSIDFDKNGSHDIHLIYGANEAGKSSLLRAIHQMFYGIPNQSKDNFIHKNSNLRIGGTISDQTNTLTFLRKKGRANTLLDAHGNTLNDSELTNFLRGVDSDFFSHMFGLDTDSLRDGANAILSGEGNLGTQLFSASLGGSSINVAIRKLEEEANKLCQGGARVGRTILPTLDKYNESESLAQESTQTVAEWNNLINEIELARNSFDELEQQLNEDRKKITKLTNYITAFPSYKNYLSLQRDLENNTAPDVSSDFVQRFRKTYNRHQEVKNELSFVNIRIEEQQKELNAIPDYKEILQYRENIEELNNNYKVYQSNLKIIEQLNLKIREIESDLQRSAQQLGLESIEEIQQLQVIPKTIQEQFKKLARTIEEQKICIDSTEEKLKEKERSIAEYEEVLKNISNTIDTTNLEELSKRCEKHNTQLSEHKSRVREIKKLIRLKEALTSRLSLSAHQNDILSLAVPSDDAIREEEERRNKLQSKIDEHQKNIESYDGELVTEQTALNKIKNLSSIYTQEDLTESRKKRDALLSNLSSSLSAKNVSNASVDASDIDLLTQLSEANHHADTIADALHTNAENITKAESHRSKIETLTLKKDNSEHYKKEALSELHNWATHWEARCKAIPVKTQSPTDLLDWRGKWKDLCSIIETLENINAETSEYNTEQQKLIEKIKKVLTSPIPPTDDDFPSLYADVKSKLELASQNQGRRESTQQSLLSAKNDREQIIKRLEKAQSDLKKSESHWQTLCSTSDISDNLHPDLVLERIEKQNQAQQRYIDYHAKKDKLTSKTKTINNYKHRAKQLAQQVLASIATAKWTNDADVEWEETTTIVRQLKQQLDVAIEQKAKAETIQKSITTEEKKLPELQPQFQTLHENIQDFLQQAQVESLDDMENAILNIETKIQLTNAIKSQRETLQQLAQETPLDAFFEQLDALDKKQIEDKRKSLQVEVESLQTKRDEARDTLKELEEKQKELQKASDAAATHKQRAVNALATIITDTERFIKLQYAIAFLRNQVEAYRKKTQGPMMEKTSHFFKTLTNERYSGVAAQLDHKGTPQLVALRQRNNATTEEVETSGLSEGTADQLYLALRLAAIDLHLDNHVPIPLILDDLLITFDDKRAKALLPVLEELSKKTQVLIFTHHHHLCGLSREVSSQIQQHQISA